MTFVAFHRCDRPFLGFSQILRFSEILKRECVCCVCERERVEIFNIPHKHSFFTRRPLSSEVSSSKRERKREREREIENRDYIPNVRIERESECERERERFKTFIYNIVLQRHRERERVID